MGRILAISFTIIILLSTASLGDIESDLRNMLLTPQEKERLLEEKRLLEPVINKRIKTLSDEFKNKLDKLGKEHNDSIQKKESLILDSKLRVELAKEFSKKCHEVRKPLREIEGKLECDRKAREILSSTRATPQQRMELGLNELRSKAEQQEYELDKLRRKVPRDPLLP